MIGFEPTITVSKTVALPLGYISKHKGEKEIFLLKKKTFLPNIKEMGFEPMKFINKYRNYNPRPLTAQPLLYIQD